MKRQIPKEIEELPNGPHKRDMIRQFVKQERRKRKDEKNNL